MSEQRQTVRGLQEVVAADTRLSFVDGANGKLYYRGYDIDELAGRASYAETVYLLWYGELPDAQELERFRAELVGNMQLPTQVVELLRLSPPNANPMVVLRTALSALGMFDPDGGRNTEEANDRKAKRILAQVACIVASLHRIRSGAPLLSPDPRSGFAWNFLYIFRGRQPDELEQRVIDSLLMLHADHGLAASTFAGRVVVSTQAGMHSAISASLASLKGPLHGGANRAVMEMLEEIEHPEHVEEYIESMLSAGERIMGFGHRIYKTEDPRSVHLRKYSEELCARGELRCYLDLSHRIEKIVRERKGIRPNVDFYSATVQRALGIPKEYYTCIFAVARCAGWIAHCMEQFADNRLIRPTSNYIGGFGRAFVPIEER
ncbi:MAG: citrate synthase [Deltaproteobacteria bacterium]|nr:citrate synthase [Deltaproteobacteria bacterium]